MNVVARLVGELDLYFGRAGDRVGGHIEFRVDDRLVFVDRQRILRELELPHDVVRIAHVGLRPAGGQLEGDHGGDQVVEARRVALDVPAVVDGDDRGDAHRVTGSVGGEVGDGLKRGLRRRPELAARDGRQAQNRGDGGPRPCSEPAVTILIHAFR